MQSRGTTEMPSSGFFLATGLIAVLAATVLALADAPIWTPYLIPLPILPLVIVRLRSGGAVAPRTSASAWLVTAGGLFAILGYLATASAIVLHGEPGWVIWSSLLIVPLLVVAVLWLSSDLAEPPVSLAQREMKPGVPLVVREVDGDWKVHWPGFVDPPLASLATMDEAVSWACALLNERGGGNLLVADARGELRLSLVVEPKAEAEARGAWVPSS